MSNIYPRGSEWRRWDLHVHTASSYDHKYKAEDSDKLLVKAWKENNLAAVAITDHFIIDKERIEKLRKMAPDITIFPGVELRTDKGASNIHVILIFPETSNLHKLSNAFQVTMLDDKAKANNDQNSDYTIYWDYNDIIDFAKRHNGLISLHTGNKAQGIDQCITNALPVNMAIKKEYASTVDFFELGQLKDIDNYKNIVLPAIKEKKPLILCSDNHDPREYNIENKLWIKADPTFDGLIQVINHPEERVYVGDIPKKLDKTIKNKKSYIDTLVVNRIDEPVNTFSNWFDVNIPLNNALTVVIGNKGSGKSAFTDIIGHFCKAKSMIEASFLNDNRFRKPPEKFSKDYEGYIKWLDGEQSNIQNLDVLEYDNSIQSAQYLPQKYIERVCTSLDDEFQKEINEVIFSYIDDTEVGYAQNLNELISIKTRANIDRIGLLQNDLNHINNEIIDLEEKLTTKYRNSILANLNKYKEDLDRHLKNKPKTVKKPTHYLKQNNINELDKINSNINKLNNEIIKRKNNLTEINVSIQELKYIKSKIEAIVREIDELNFTLNKSSIQFEFDQERFKISYITPIKMIEEKLTAFQLKRSSLIKILDNSEKADPEISLYKQLNNLSAKKKMIISEANEKEKAYQKYLQDLQEWNKHTKEIEKFIETYSLELDSIENVLPNKYKLKRAERLDKVKEIFVEKKAIAKIYSEVYEPVESKFKTILSDIDSNIEFTVNIALDDKGIAIKLLNYINQSYAGKFYGKAESLNLMNKYLKETNFNDMDSIYNFINEVLGCIDEDQDISSKKVKNKLGFYDLLTGLSYIDVKYNLKLNRRTLEELSPGERGIVLLVFYLALNKEEIPLIIDQPEDNLDNQSVYDQLVPCICEAKKRRQVIIVTHNPNIAIACDAEQIICCNISKLDNKISYISGSIENQAIRSKIIDILEGTEPAFNLRKRKYRIK